MGELFYTGLFGADAIFIAVLLLLAVLAIPVARIPDLFGAMREALYYGREGTFFAYLSRYFSIRLFKAITHWQSAATLTLCIYLIGIRSAILPPAQNWHDLFPPLTLFAALIVFAALRRFVYRLLAYLFVPEREAKNWSMGYAILEWLWCLSLLPVLVVATIPGATSIAIVLLSLFFLSWRIALFVRTIPSLRAARVGWVHLFIYLCAHEMLPFLYLAVGIWMATGSNNAVLWQQA